ncbi:MAG: SIMPL domain-containing protein, partial [Porticoccaceae bacterium]|nr:SIMPL domain-containing protein [Porticoccaceae bacterium]
MSITSQILIIALLSLGAVSCDAQTSQRTIITYGSGLVSVSANMAELHLQLQAVNRNSAVAKQDVDSRINDFIRALKRIGIDKADVIAATLRLSPNYEYINQKQRFTGFRATRSVTVTLSDLEQLNELMDN